jgi:hypothetical protein
MTPVPDIVAEAKVYVDTLKGSSAFYLQDLVERLAAEVVRLRAELGEEKGLTP